MLTTAQRFWSHVDKSSECWLWTGPKQRGGYGLFGLKKHPPHAKIGAHRMAYILTYGPIQISVNVLHRCDNPPCVNPDHLFLGTQSENIADAISKGRYARGERKGNAKLTDTDVRQIRILRETGLSYTQLAANFGVTRSLIGQVLTGKIWRHVEASTTLGAP